MKRIINEIDYEIENIKKMEYILKQLKLWFMCKKNYINHLPEHEIANLEKLILTIEVETRNKYPDLMGLINYYFNLIKVGNFDLVKMLDQEESKIK